MEKIKLELSKEDTVFILNVLAAQQYSKVNTLIENIKVQLIQQEIK